jgi:DNA-directed RNA polymerase specialized sigma subunit
MVKRRHRWYPGLSKDQRKLVEEHMWIAGRLAYSAKCMTGGHTGSLTREDLESIARFALCVAATKFDPEMNVKYSTYAWKTARGYIQHALRDYSRLVKTPRWVSKYKEQVLEMLKNHKTYAEIAKELNIDENRVLDCQLSENNYHVSYDLQPEDWATSDFIYNSDEVKSTLLSTELIAAIKSLSDPEMEIMLTFINEDPMLEEDKSWASTVFNELQSIAHGFPETSHKHPPRERASCLPN